MRVVIAPDKFKGCLTAAEVAAAVAAGITSVVPDVDVVRRPVADGGDGTVAAAIEAGFERVEVDAEGPTGEPRLAEYARSLDGAIAVVELAAVVGLDLLPGGRLEPLTASTYGLGQVIGHALDSGATEVVLGLGGSASTDGGAGMVQALGATLRDASGAELNHGGGALGGLDSVELGPLWERVGDAKFVVASDVDNPLLGERGAAAVFGPQKGAEAFDLVLLERGLTTWARVVSEATGRNEAERPGTGAAGGTGYAAVALLGAELRPGIEMILELLGVEAELAGADLVITGEGSLDEQSLAGKAPIGVARAAGRAGAPVVAVSGRCLLSPERLSQAGITRAYPLSDLEPDVARSIAEAAPLLRQVGATIGKEWLM